jgi:UDP-3-O-[3-hydroxymyristoyl] glucosamine N-acyltransferase
MLKRTVDFGKGIKGVVELGENVTLSKGVNFAKPIMLELRGGRRVFKEMCLKARIGNDVHIGENSIITLGVTRPTVLGENCIIGHLVNIGHDCIIGKHAIISTGSILCGYSEIGEYSYLGVGTLVKPEIKIGSFCRIGMGCRVVKDLPDNTTLREKIEFVRTENLWRPEHESNSEN